MSIIVINSTQDSGCEGTGTRTSRPRRRAESEKASLALSLPDDVSSLALMTANKIKPAVLLVLDYNVLTTTPMVDSVQILAENITATCSVASAGYQVRLKPFQCLT
jgi:hypothetical protein